MPTPNKIIDLDLSATEKKKFRFGHDDNRIVELNTSDMGIIARISDAYPKLTELQEQASKLMDGIEFDENDDAAVRAGISTMADRLKVVDDAMRGLIDYMFDAPVSAAAAPSGSMYDPFNGSFRFEYIITLLMNQYETNLKDEYAKMEKQLNKHTAKYKKGG